MICLFHAPLLPRILRSPATPPTVLQQGLTTYFKVITDFGVTKVNKLTNLWNFKIFFNLTKWWRNLGLRLYFQQSFQISYHDESFPTKLIRIPNSQETWVNISISGIIIFRLLFRICRSLAQISSHLVETHRQKYSFYHKSHPLVGLPPSDSQILLVFNLRRKSIFKFHS